MGALARRAVYNWSNEIERGRGFGLRRLTAPVRARPDYIIAGAGKCGTTTMQAYVSAHPDVRAPLGKELHYFDHNRLLGERWYRAHFPVGWRRRSWLTGEATPYYLCHPAVPRRVAGAVPDVKIIVLLRDPIDRALSQYRMARSEYGCEPLSFDDAIGAEEQRLAGEHERLDADPGYRSYNHLFFSYKDRGRYAEQLERWFRHFARDQMLLIRSEDFFAHPARTLAEVFAFLQLPPWEPPDFPVHNKGAYRESMSAAAREHLGAYFAAPNERLAELIGWPAPIWS